MRFIKQNYSFNYFEPLIIIAFWALLFASPLLFGRFENNIDWNHIQIVWLSYLPLLALFLINRFILLPKLFFKDKKFIYFIITSSIILLIGTTIYFFSENNLENKFDDSFRRPPIENAKRDEFLNQPPPRPQDNLPTLKHNTPQPQPIPEYANFLIIAVLLVGFDAGLQISMRWANLEQEKFKLQKENIENQLAFLRNQVSPHFFMNTLNNIHALVDIDSDQAKQSIIKLSKLMRHLLYESEEKLTPITKEIEFINSYIELMRLRFSEKVKINVHIPKEIPNKLIPPLLFTSLVENAFKHGISYSKDSFIIIDFSFLENNLVFEIQNSNHSKKSIEKGSGIGIENTKKRLDLIYKDNYTLNVIENDEIYSVKLNIPL